MTQQTKTLFIIDGHAQIYSAYYAPMASTLSSPAGEPTKAVFIFTTIVLKLLRERKPDMLAVAMDAPGPTFRHKMYDQYKAHRPPMPEDLPSQIARIEQILAAMNIPVLRVSGYEADDLIGTMTKQAAQKNVNVYICSKDKDLEQLLDDRVAMFDPKTDTVLDIAGLLQNKGIRPDQVIDILAIQGDASDNVPGVPDVGPKTALQWIQQFGSLDHLIENADQIKGKRGDNLRAGLDQLRLSRQLVTIDRYVPLEIPWETLAVKPFNTKALRDIFMQLGFKKLLDQLEIPYDAKSAESSQSDRPATPETVLTHSPTADYRLIDSPETFDDFFEQLKKQQSFSIDTETTNINPVWAELVGLSFSWQAGIGYYLPLKAPLGQKHLDRKITLDRLSGILTDPNIKKIGQNIKYDMIVLRRVGVEVAGVAFDTMVASYIQDSERQHYNLDSLAKDYLGHDTIKLESLIGKGKNQLTFDQVDTRLAADYSAEDAEVAWRLAQRLEPRFKDDQLRNLFHRVEMPLVEVLAAMEYNGVAVDVPCLKKLSHELSRRMEKLIDDIHQQAGCNFNVDSPKQLSEVLFDRLGLKSVKKTKTGSSTDQDVLETLRWQHPIAALMLEYRQLSKLKNTYVDKLPVMIFPATGRIHASFNQTIAATGRLSSSNPNLQNIPIRSELGQEIRRAFIPQHKNSVLLAADYSQIELRILAHLSRDASLQKAFHSGQDIHRYVAAQVNGVSLDQVDDQQRSKAKAVNFGIIYGQGAYGLSQQIGVSVSQAQRFIDDYFQKYPRIREFMDDTISQAKKNGYVSTILGRRRQVPQINSKNVANRRLDERIAVNTVVQGSAADMIKLAMINIHRKIQNEKIPVKMILQVHDELVFELPEDYAKECADMVREEMACAIKLAVPVVVDIGYGSNWLVCK
jgi:DNA polymerase I